VVKAVTHEEVDFETLGGAAVHVNRSGVAHFSAENEDAIFDNIRWLLSFLPSNNLASSPYVVPSDDPARPNQALSEIVPQDPQKPYDIREVIQEIVDSGEFLEVQESYAQNIVIGFARMNGNPVGIVANQPLVLAGVLDINSRIKPRASSVFATLFTSRC
jgi:acetyl-CoA carboxylase carboxyltransferase component